MRVRIAEWKCPACRRFGEEIQEQITMDVPTAELLAVNKHEELRPDCRAYIRITIREKELQI